VWGGGLSGGGVWCNIPRRMEYEELIRVVREMRGEVRGVVGSIPERLVCGGVTHRGVPCRNRARVGGEGFCGMHGGPRVVTKVAKVPKAPKARKVQPEHTHGVGEGVCVLCGTHGDVWDEGLPWAEFEGAPQFGE
jgi:hypothetical protein